MKYIVKKVNDFIDTYYSDELSDDYYYLLKEDYYYDYENKFHEDYAEIINFFEINDDIFPFDFDMLGYEELEDLIKEQFSVFDKKFLSNTNDGESLVAWVLNNPECIFNYIKKYKDNYIYVSIFKVLYIIALIHNNRSTFVILVLVKHLRGLLIKFENHRLNFDRYVDNLSLEKHIYDLLRKHPILKKYMEFNRKKF